MGKLSEELRDLLIRQGSVPSEGFRLDDGRVIMEDTVTTAQIGDGTEGTITFEEGLCGLECMNLTPEQAAWLVSAPHARRLITDALAVIVGWGDDVQRHVRTRPGRRVAVPRGNGCGPDRQGARDRDGGVRP